MWIGALWAGLQVAMWITHVGDKFRHGLLEKSLIKATPQRPYTPCRNDYTNNSLRIIAGTSLHRFSVMTRKVIPPEFFSE